MSDRFTATAKGECACTGAREGCKTRKFWNLLYNLQKKFTTYMPQKKVGIHLWKSFSATDGEERKLTDINLRRLN
jgi:hypothetical protein